MRLTMDRERILKMVNLPMTKTGTIDLKKIFEIRNEHMQKEEWWYWFWLFFFDNPKNPKKPRQLMVLWSSKNEKEIECNGVNLKMEDPLKGNKLNGAVASWYFDGKRMHENFMLEQCDLTFTKDSIRSYSSNPTSFVLKGKSAKISMGKDFKFNVKINECYRPTVNTITFSNKSRYTNINAIRFKMKGNAYDEPIEGSAFFECMFCSIPIPSWYWGTFHFENGAVMNYFEPYLFRKPLRSVISFYDCNGSHIFNGMKIREVGRNNPRFIVSAKNKNEKIDFKVSTYSRATWKFKKKHPGIIGIIPNKLTYNEYPAVITEFKLSGKGKTINLKDLGKSVGNAEHTEGVLL
jgi:hypothetical protein